MVAAWRWDVRDEYPEGHLHGGAILRRLHQGPPCPALAVTGGPLIRPSW